MTTRRAACRCGQLTAECRGEPVRISVCHCFACQRRTGSAFAAQARFPGADVAITGKSREWRRVADSGGEIVYSFCPECGSTVHYVATAFPGVIAIPLGAFADPDFPAPKFSVWEAGKHGWVALIGDDIEHSG